MQKFILTSLLAVSLAACSQSDVTAQAADEPAQKSPAKSKPAKSKPVKSNLTIEELGGGFFVLFGPGGNIGVSVGEDGVYVVDDKFERLGQDIIDTIGGLTDQPIRFVHNTHHHGDHTGANAKMREIGATVIAHDNVYERMSKSFPSQRAKSGKSKPAPADRWPNMTFSDKLTLHFNGQTVRAIHIPAAHTAGDSIIVFEQANIIHMGDNYFNGIFPFVDVDGGGNSVGMIAAQDLALSLANAETKIIPGHGVMASKADLQASRDILVDIQGIVKARMDKGESLEAIIKARPLEKYADMSSFIDEDNMIRSVYRSLK